jgi:hypothetical protein
MLLAARIGCQAINLNGTPLYKTPSALESNVVSLETLVKSQAVAALPPSEPE